MKQFKTMLMVLAAVLIMGAPAFAQTSSVPATSQDVLKAIAQAKGKVVVVNFWAAWCGPCRQEIPELIALRKRIPEDKLFMIGVSIDQEPAMYAAFVARTGFNYPVLRAAQDVTPAFNIRAIPRTMVYAPSGELHHVQEGYMPGDELEKMIQKLLGA